MTSSVDARSLYFTFGREYSSPALLKFSILVNVFYFQNGGRVTDNGSTISAQGNPVRVPSPITMSA